VKDTELRGILLRKYYDLRRERLVSVDAKTLGVDLPDNDVLSISEQLEQHGLIEWKPLRNFGLSGGGIAAAMGKITAKGIDVVEGEPFPNLRIEFVQNKNYTVTNSPGAVVGDNNVQQISTQLSNLAQLIDSANASPVEKNEAKGLLAAFLRHPLVGVLLGAAAGAILK
jgi:hypothetical protein